MEKGLEGPSFTYKPAHGRGERETLVPGDEPQGTMGGPKIKLTCVQPPPLPRKIGEGEGAGTTSENKKAHDVGKGSHAFFTALFTA